MNKPKAKDRQSIETAIRNIQACCTIAELEGLKESVARCISEDLLPQSARYVLNFNHMRKLLTEGELEKN